MEFICKKCGEEFEPTATELKLLKDGEIQSLEICEECFFIQQESLNDIFDDDFNN